MDVVFSKVNYGRQKNDDWNQNEDFFRYTKYRFVYNEAEQLARRYVKFDMNELARIAADSVGSSPCQRVEKYAEGESNKIFLVTTEEGKEVIAKVPQPQAGCPHFTTASEVATMDYARNVLGLPIPKIYAWSSESLSTSVGAEYIIMEKAPGKELEQFWPELPADHKIQILTQLVQFQKRLTAPKFPGIGSLYYAESLNANDPCITLEERQPKNASSSRKFVIGPTNDHRFKEDPDDSSCDRGAWSRIEDYLVAVGRYSLDHTHQGSVTPGIFGGPGWYQPSNSRKVAALNDYIKITPYLLPEDSTANTAVLWHDDLHSGNILVDPDDPGRIVCLIDWQSSHIAPLFRHHIRPTFLDFEGPKPMLGFDGDARKPPKLPANFQELSHEEQKNAEALRHQQTFYKMFEILSAKENPYASEALLHEQTLSCQLIDFASLIGRHAEPVVKSRLIEAVDEWEQIVGPEGPPCPLEYTEEERKANAEELQQWAECVQLKDSVIQSLGVQANWDGFSTVDEYPAARKKFLIVRKEFLDHMAKNDEERVQWAKVWPFTDDEYVDE
ncbi:MAG: hypothetical protein Q9170_007160 [Blastenia crenularia]